LILFESIVPEERYIISCGCDGKPRLPSLPQSKLSEPVKAHYRLASDMKDSSWAGRLMSGQGKNLASVGVSRALLPPLHETYPCPWRYFPVGIKIA